MIESVISKSIRQRKSRFILPLYCKIFECRLHTSQLCRKSPRSRAWSDKLPNFKQKLLRYIGVLTTCTKRCSIAPTHAHRRCPFSEKIDTLSAHFCRLVVSDSRQPSFPKPFFPFLSTPRNTSVLCRTIGFFALVTGFILTLPPPNPSGEFNQNTLAPSIFFPP